MAERPSKHQYYMRIAQAISTRGTCLRRLVGAIIVKNDRIISTGYVGSPRGEPNCVDINICRRKKVNVPSGQFYEICKSVHAEENTLINAAASGVNINGATIYLFSAPRSKEAYPKGQEPSTLYLPCYRCKKMIINSGLKEVVILAGNKIKKITIADLRKLIKKDEIEQGENFRRFIKNES